MIDCPKPAIENMDLHTVGLYWLVNGCVGEQQKSDVKSVGAVHPHPSGRLPLDGQGVHPPLAPHPPHSRPPLHVTAGADRQTGLTHPPTPHNEGLLLQDEVLYTPTYDAEWGIINTYLTYIAEWGVINTHFAEWGAINTYQHYRMRCHKHLPALHNEV